MDWHECVHSVVTSPVLEVPSAENPTADCPLTHHLNVSTEKSRCRRQYCLLRPPSSHTTRQHIHPAVTDCFSRRADMFPVTDAEFAANGTVNFLVNQYLPLWGCSAPYSRTTDGSSAPSFHKLYISCWGCTSLLQAPRILTVTGALSA